MEEVYLKLKKEEFENEDRSEEFKEVEEGIEIKNTPSIKKNDDSLDSLLQGINEDEMELTELHDKGVLLFSGIDKAGVLEEFVAENSKELRKIHAHRAL